jgi:hypothetical protein
VRVDGDAARVGEAGGAGGGEGAVHLGGVQPDGECGVGERLGDLLSVQEAAADVAVDLERAGVEGAVAGARRRLLELRQLVGKHAAAVGMPDRHRERWRVHRAGCW